MFVLERTLTPEERIRRAEEIYKARRAEGVKLRSSSVNIGVRPKYKFFKKMILQIAICMMIYLIFYLIQNGQYLFSEEVIQGAKEILAQDLNIETLTKQIEGWFQSQEEGEKQTDDAIGGANEEGNAILENFQVNGTENTNTIAQEEQYQEEASTVNQMEEDANFVKQNYSLIKPLSGTITSRFGLRNPTTPTVPKYHTGLDIAANTGTVIIAAMDGTVELASSEGDYGNHLKIVNGEVMTLYAHCNTLYVKEGEEIKQGQQIAEVGATGNVTGAHLHFEIRRNNRYINPEYVLEF